MVENVTVKSSSSSSPQPLVRPPIKRPLADYVGRSLYKKPKVNSNETRDPLAPGSKHFGRVAEPYITINLIVKWGLRRGNPDRCIEKHLSRQDMSEPDKKWYFNHLDRCYDKLLQLNTNKTMRLKDMLEHGDINTIISRIEQARSVGHSDDVRKSKFGIIDWLGPDVEPPLGRVSKHDRGFSHPQIGRLLAPIDVDWDDEEQRASLVTQSRIPRPHETTRLLWRDGAYEKKHFWKGFLRHELAVKAFKHIFISPRAALLDNVRGTGRSIKKGSAASNSMHSVNLESIVYVHTQVHFALTDIEIFSRENDIFSHAEFYTHLLRFLYAQQESENGKTEITHLIEWWNSKVFPGRRAFAAGARMSDTDSQANTLSALLAASKGSDDSVTSETSPVKDEYDSL